LKNIIIRGRSVHEGVVSLQEIIHDTKAKRLRVIFLKLNFEKAYDRVDWGFLRKVLLGKGYNLEWVHRALDLVSGSQTAIAINGEIGNFFRSAPG
jgi:hypothetical protein